MPIEQHNSSLPPKADRRAALVLRQVEAALGEVLSSVGGDGPAARAAAGATAHQVLMVILRRRATLDWLIARASSGQTRDRVRRVLWWALAEALFLDGLPVPVIVDTAVEDLKLHSRGEGAFANALLRRILGPGRAAVLAAVQTEAPPWVRLDLGEALHAVWSPRLTPPALTALAALLQEPAPLVARLRAGADPAGVAGLEPLPAVDWAPTLALYRCHDAVALFASAAWKRRAFYLQDTSTLLAPALLAAQAGEQVVDLCCAPGGKSLLLSEAVGPSGSLVCVDRSAERMVRVRENLAAATNVRLLVADARNTPFANGAFDAALLDVPCSNTGVVRRRPDVRWHFSPAGRDELALVQAQILAAAARLVRPGGRLVYSTCSLEPEENGAVVQGFLAERPGYSLECERLLLPDGDHDGAYAARLRRRSAEPGG
jgi:16S rRNA (cytosine967-C5)-methyltransferase